MQLMALIPHYLALNSRHFLLLFILRALIRGSNCQYSSNCIIKLRFDDFSIDPRLPTTSRPDPTVNKMVYFTLRHKNPSLGTTKWIKCLRMQPVCRYQKDPAGQLSPRSHLLLQEDTTTSPRTLMTAINFSLN